MIFNYKDYRVYLRNFIESQPNKGRGQISKLASALNVSPTLISQILMGTKELTQEQAIHLSDYLGLTGFETDYFMSLVHLSRSGNDALKKYWQRKISQQLDEHNKVARRVQPKKHLSESERSVFYSSPLYTAIRLYSSTADSGRSLDEISERFEISRQKAIEILQFLMEANLVNQEKSLYKMGAQSTHLEHGSPHLLKHHTNWRLRSIQSHEVLSPEELMYTAPVSISREDFKLLREELLKFIQAFLKKVHASPAEEVACLNIDWFWIR
jgi:uncharacterized protein (TIGR02147 family)